MLNKLWFGFFAAAGLMALGHWLLLGDYSLFNAIVSAIFEMARLSVEIALGLIGLLAFWCGLLKITEAAGIAAVLARWLAPLFARLMPEVPIGHPAVGLVTLNLTANMLGLDNAATPIGLKAMRELQSLNRDVETASNAQILFLVLNTSSVTVFPVTILMYRLQQGALNPAEVFLPILLATACSTLVGLISVAIIQRINLFDRIIMAYLGGLLLLLGGLVIWLSGLAPSQMGEVSAAIGNAGLLGFIILVLAVGQWRKIPVYETFVEGAREGFDIAVKIVPYMVAMLTAIGALRASGLLQRVVDGIAWSAASLGLDTSFAAALPTGLMRPFTASGSRAMMLETMANQGVDSFAAKMAAVMQGSTETTFYVLSVYFGAVGIKRVRHAIGCGLLADFAGLLAAVLFSYWFFNR